jgi:ATP-binding cassette subfamily C (CFTR/MRP) protein 1
LTPSSKVNYDQGQIVNLIQNDADKIMGFTWELAEIFTLPVILGYCIIFLFKLLGWSFLSGLTVFAIGGIVNLYISKKIKDLDLEKKEKIDKRLNYTTEALNNIKTLKFYQWIDIFQKEVEKRRDAEQKVLYRIINLLCFMWAFGTFFPAMMSTVSLYTYVATKNTIDLATAFTVLIFFDKISHPMEALPWVINNTLELLVSIKRI